MTTITAHSGSDTWVRDDKPNRNQSGGNRIRLQASHARGLIHIPVTDIRGRTILSATLTGHVRDGFTAQTVTVVAVTSSWSAGKATWNNQPNTGAAVTTTLGALSDGDTADLDVLTILQAVANGTPWRGLRLSTSATTAGHSDWYAFDATQPAWVLTIELSDAPEQPSDLRPNVGAVASSAPVLAWSYTDLGGDSSEQGAFKVQVDPDADEVSPAFDTGWVTSADPEYDLSSGAFTPLGSGDDTQWRVQTRDAVGNESAWSDWASFSYEPAATLTMDSPTGGTIGDSTPDVIAHLTGETLTQWRVRVEDTAGNVLWNSGLSDGPLSITVPKRNDDGYRIIKRDDATYRIRVRAWGDVDRADAVGLPAYVEQIVDVVFDDDAGVDTPTAVTVDQLASGDPRLVFTWFLDEAPDAVMILDDGDVYARLDSDDWTVDAGTYRWVDGGHAAAYTGHSFAVRAIDGGHRSHLSAAVAITPKIRGVWLIADPDVADPVNIDGTVSVDGFAKNDRRATYKLFNADTDLDIVTGQEGISAAFQGTLERRPDRSKAQVAAAVRALNAIAADVYGTPRLLFGNVSIPILVRNLSAIPASDWTDANRLHNVNFAFIEAGD